MLTFVLALLTAASMASPASAQVAGADLGVTIASRSGSVEVGEDVLQTVTATNAGPQEATGLVLTVTLPEGLVVQSTDGFPGPCDSRARVVCTLASLPAGGSVGLDLLLGATGPGRLATSATVDASQEDPVPGNERASVTVETAGPACDRVGTVDADRLRPPGGGGGVCGLGGDDILLGGARADDLLGGSGNDSLVGDGGRDGLDGGEGFDSCTGDPGPGAERDCEARVFALAGGLPLTGLGPATVGYGYHQSLFGTAIGMRPLVDHVVMSSRGRGTGASTAADVVVGSGARVRSPVTGRVVAVKRYLLYCERPDWKIAIAPFAEPDLRVLVLHLGRPGVRPGDTVQAGVTRLGRARPNDWADSQANRYFPERYPHVHVEVERNRASPTPGCAI